MHIVNPDLLRAAAAHHPDGRPKNPHAHHLAEHLAALRVERAARWQATLTRIRALVGKPALSQGKAPSTCS